jgi:hypothetical protein
MFWKLPRRNLHLLHLKILLAARKDGSKRVANWANRLMEAGLHRSHSAKILLPSAPCQAAHTRPCEKFSRKQIELKEFNWKTLWQTQMLYALEVCQAAA